MVPYAQEIIKTARGYLSPRLIERPSGSNDGRELRAALANTQFVPGQPWCYYFALACLIDVFGDRHKLPDSVAFTGSCQLAANHAAKLGKLSEWAATGAIFLLPNEQGHFHHAGIVQAVSVQSNNVTKIITVEGNTNNDGSVNGFGVFGHVRNEKDVKYIIWDMSDLP